MKKLFLRNLVNKFNLEVLAGVDKLDKTEIAIYGINRAGLELTGFFAQKVGKEKRIVLLSSKESEYISQFDDQTKEQKYTKLMQTAIPTIIVTQKYTDQTIIDVARKLNFPLLKIDYPSTSEITSRILEFLDLFFAPQTEVHASLVNIYGRGVLIVGESGIGKSEVAIDLIKKNHLFIGDDRIIITNKSNRLFGKSHPILQNLVEVRGIGIVDISRSNGYQVIMEESTVDLVLELFKFKKDGVDDTDRLGNEYTTKDILGVDVPYIRIPVSPGRNMANLIESAASQLKIKQSGIEQDVINLMNERIKEENEN